MKKAVIAVFVLLLSVSLASAAWNINSNYIDTEMILSSEIGVLYEKSNSELSSLAVNVSFIPLDLENQKILSLDTYPDAKISEQSIIFEYEKPKSRKLNYQINSRIRTINTIMPIRTKVRFPLTVQDDLEIYTEPSSRIDSEDSNIIQLASKVGQGKDDLFLLEFALAGWIEDNVNYSLSTLTADVNQKASWVLENRYGVCDEITNLFIAMNRALGVPARFISGVAYSSDNDFGPHGWAEVYFPGYGWAPYDVTYGQLGYIDPTHIKLKESLDGSDSIINYRWLGRDVEIEPSKLDINTEVIEYKGFFKPNIDIDIEVEKPNIRFGSYNLIKAEIKNLEKYYQATEVKVYSTKEVEFIDSKNRIVALRPNEKKTIYWIIKLGDSLKKDFRYTFPVNIYSSRNDTSSTFFNSEYEAALFSLDDMEELMFLHEEDKVLSADIELKCKTTEIVRLGDKLLADCSIRNTGTAEINDLVICIDDNCETTSILIAQEKKFQIDISNDELGLIEKTLTAKNSQISEFDTITYKALDDASIIINISEAPLQVRYDEDYKIEVYLKRDSYSLPQNILMQISENSVKREWTIDQLPDEQGFELQLNSKDLKPGVNTFNILLEYEDELGKRYTDVKSISIELVGLNIWQKLFLLVKSWFVTIGSWLTQ